MRRIFSGALLLCFLVGAQAQEKPVQLAEGAGRETVETFCSVCHSLDYMQINAWFLDHQGWQNEVTKMIKVFGAPISADDARVIVDYLAQHYGSGGRASQQ